MQAPTSRNQLDRLGKRLAAANSIPDEDFALFGEVLEFYLDLLDHVCEPLENMGLAPTSRVKTTGTLIEKLRRERGIQLSRIQDLAGARIITKGNTDDQDRLVQRIRAEFLHHSRPPSVIDRRATPTSGYRAVHIVVYPHDFPVEIQVRTALQDAWAQIFERLADQWGRGIRYGEFPSAAESTPPKNPHAEAQFRGEVIRRLMKLSDTISELETVRSKAQGARQVAKNAQLLNIPEFPESPLESICPGFRSEYLRWRNASIKLLETLEEDKRRRGRIIRRLLPKGSTSYAQLTGAKDAISRLVNARMVDLMEHAQTRETRLRKALETFARIADKEEAP